MQTTRAPELVHIRLPRCGHNSRKDIARRLYEPSGKRPQYKIAMLCPNDLETGLLKVSDRASACFLYVFFLAQRQIYKQFVVTVGAS
jgi:hypothetical protein